MTEGELQAGLVEAAIAAGWLYYHTHDSRRSVAGFPDLVLVHARRQRLMLIECKGPKGVVSEAQGQWLTALGGYAAHVADWAGNGCEPWVGICDPSNYDEVLGIITGTPTFAGLS